MERYGDIGNQIVDLMTSRRGWVKNLRNITTLQLMNSYTIKLSYVVDIT